MAKNNLKTYKYWEQHSCGHYDRFIVHAYTEDYALDKMKEAYSGLCPACAAIELERRRLEATEAAKEKADGLNLPELTGTEKQINWALQIREDFINLMEECKNLIENIDKHDARFHMALENASWLLKILNWMFETQTDSRFWIDNRFNNSQKLYELYKVKVETVGETGKTDEELQAEIEDELTAYPENFGGLKSEIIKDAVDNKIKLKSPKDDAIIEVARSLGYTWNNPYWTKNISNKLPSVEDAVVELASKLLNEGVAVILPNQALIDRAINADYVPENDRWIMGIGDTEKVRITWRGRNDDLYNSAKSIKGSKWNNGMVVPASMYKEIEDFAELNGFNISEAAQSKLDKEKNRELMKVAKPVEVEAKDALKELLQSPERILEDLKDD